MTGPDAEVFEDVRWRCRIEDEVLLHTKSQLRETLSDNAEVDRLRVPTMAVSSRDTYYIVRQDAGAPKRCKMFMEFAADGKTVRLDQSQVLSEKAHSRTPRHGVPRCDSQAGVRRALREHRQVGRALHQVRQPREEGFSGYAGACAPNAAGNGGKEHAL